ncbi:hypothetical protein GC176_01675 [bacterium]|nr:hypothetical protein [bacterium]
MAYFSRLTDIVTCNLTRLLEEADDPQAALQEIIHEMETGLAGARRSMTTAEANETRIQSEVDEHAEQISHWADQARSEVAAGHEDRARLALVRKREAEDLVASLKEELAAAQETREHLTRTFRALEARLAEARRREGGLDTGDSASSGERATAASSQVDDSIEDELAALKRELGQQ